MRINPSLHDEVVVVLSQTSTSLHIKKNLKHLVKLIKSVDMWVQDEYIKNRNIREIDILWVKNLVTQII
jgi:hypothetical protein